MSLFVFTKVTLQSGETATVYYLTEEGKKLLEHLQAMEKYEENRFHNLVERLDKMQDELIRTFYLERMMSHITLSLKSNPKTQQEVAKTLPDFTGNPMLYHAFYMAWKQFEKSGVILPTSHGRGHPRTWELSILKKEEAK